MHGSYGCNIDRECLRADIEAEVWADFFRELLPRLKVGQADPFELIKEILQGASTRRFLLPGREIIWSGDICHYQRLDRLNEEALGFPVGGERVLDRVAAAIENKTCTGRAMEDSVLGRTDRPLWIRTIRSKTRLNQNRYEIGSDSGV